MPGLCAVLAVVLVLTAPQLIMKMDLMSVVMNDSKL